MGARLRFTELVSHSALFMSVGFNLSRISKAGQFVAMIPGKSVRHEGTTKHFNRWGGITDGPNRLRKVGDVEASSARWLHNVTPFHRFDSCAVRFDRLSARSGPSLLQAAERAAAPTRLLSSTVITVITAN